MTNKTMLVFMTPRTAGKTDKLKESIFSKDEETIFFSELGISKYLRWIQEIRSNFFLIHQIEGIDPKGSFEVLREKIIQNDSVA